jgi:hypothetical protein
MAKNLTRHAEIRCRQRGVRYAVVHTVLKYSDIETPSHSGCKRLQLSHKAIDSMLAEGMSVAQADAAKKLALIVDEADRVITVIKVAGCGRRVRAKRASPRTRFNH